MALATFYHQLEATQRDIYWYVDRFGSIRGKYRLLRHPWKRLTTSEVCPLEGAGGIDLARHTPEHTFLGLQTLGLKRRDAQTIIWAANGRRAHDQGVRRELMQAAGIESNRLQVGEPS